MKTDVAVLFGAFAVTYAKFAPNKHEWDMAGFKGGSCICPDGQVYGVGDNFDDCATMACEGGVAGTCNRYFSPEWAFSSVKCGADLCNDIDKQGECIAAKEDNCAWIDDECITLRETEVHETCSQFQSSRDCRKRERRGCRWLTKPSKRCVHESVIEEPLEQPEGEEECFTQGLTVQGSVEDLEKCNGVKCGQECYTYTPRCAELNVEYSGNGLKTIRAVKSALECQKVCQNTEKCLAFTFVPMNPSNGDASHCELKTTRANDWSKVGVVSAARECELNAMLCYPECKQHYTGWGPLCTRNC